MALPVFPAPSPTSTTLTSAHLAGIVRRLAARPDLWTSRIRFNAGERWYERLVDTVDYEVWLLTWLPGQGTEIHDHGGSSGAFAVVHGELTERSFARSRRSQPAPWALPAGGLRAFGPHHVHEVTNRGAEPAASIHVYSPSLTTMWYYHHVPDGSLEHLRTDPVEAVEAVTVSRP